MPRPQPQPQHNDIMISRYQDIMISLYHYIIGKEGTWLSPKGKPRGFCENHRQPPCPPPRGGWHAKRDGRSLREFWLYQTDDCRLLPPPPNGGPPPSRRGRLWAAGCRPYNVCLSPLFPKRELPFSSKPNKCLTNTKRCSIIRGRSEKKGRKWRWMRPFNENWRY